MLPIRRMWKTPEVRNSLLFVFLMLVIFRVAAHIPVPGVDASALSNVFQNNQLFGLLNLFSGGTLENFSIVALGVAPYITSSIIFQLLGLIFPNSIGEMQKEQQGQATLNRWTRLLTVPLAFIQGYSLILLFRQQAAQGLFASTDLLSMVLAMGSLTAGTIFLMWIGELISEKNVGNGTSILIFAGIIAGLPNQLQQAAALYDSTQLVTVILFLAATIATIVGIVVMNEAQRKIPVQYARQMRGSKLASAVASFLPLKLNIGGVIPIIFAVSMILFPTVFAQFFVNARTPWVSQTAQWLIAAFANHVVYGIVFFVLVFSFTYFYASVVFQPDRVAENLQKQGGFVPGIRPGQPTAEYLGWVTNRLLLSGALFLGLIAVLPTLVQQATGNPNLIVGGTSILIIVAVVIDSVKQIEAQLTMREYEI